MLFHLSYLESLQGKLAYRCLFVIFVTLSIHHYLMKSKGLSFWFEILFSVFFWSSHHGSLKAQKAINEVTCKDPASLFSQIIINCLTKLLYFHWQLFVKYNIQFSGVSKNVYSTLEDTSDGLNFEDLVSKISSMSFDLNGSHWR